MEAPVDPQLDTSPQSMNVNPPPSLRIIRAKDLGSKLKDDAFYSKLITVGEDFLQPALAERTKYWFVVPVPHLQIRIFAIQDTDFMTTDVTQEYYAKGKDHLDIHYYEHYTIFNIQFTTKARSLLFVWHNEEHFYTDLFFVKKVKHNIPMKHILPPIYQLFGVALPPADNNNDAVLMDTDQPMQDIAEQMTDVEVAVLMEQAQGPNNNRTEPHHTLTLWDESSSTDARDDTDVENNTNVTRVDYHMSDINYPTMYPRTIASNTNIKNRGQYGSESNNNNTNRVENSAKSDQVSSKHQTKRNIRIVTIKATELARKWTWEAYVLEHPNIRYDEIYMRGGQACNSVIVQCKQKMYEDYPDDEIHFILQVRSRRKDPLKLRGQKFLNAVMFSWWLRQPESAVKDEEDDKPDPNIVTDHPVRQHRARPVHVTDDNTVVIMVFELEYPESYDQNRWVVQVCDDDKLLAIELRTEHFDLNERAQLIADVKQQVRVRLGRLFGYTDIKFKEDVWHRKPDKLRAWAYWWLGAATNRAINFANWAGKVINYFTIGNNNNNN